MGSSGRTIPKPIRSMKTVRKMTSSDGLLMNKSAERGSSAPRGAADNQASANLQRHARSLSAGEGESRKRGARGAMRKGTGPTASDETDRQRAIPKASPS